MEAKEILHFNKFANCSKDKLIELWNGLKEYYEYTYVDNLNPLREYANKYVEESESGLVSMERDLLRAIACKFCEEVK